MILLRTGSVDMAISTFETLPFRAYLGASTRLLGAARAGTEPRTACPHFAAFGQGDRLFNSDPDCSHTAFIAAQNRTWWLAAKAAHIKFG